MIKLVFLQTNLKNTMKAIKLLHKNLLTACPDIHEVRLKALMAGVASALREHQVTVTSLGRNLKSKSKTHTKHDIKRMDRLIGNKHLHAERKKEAVSLKMARINIMRKKPNSLGY